MSRLGPSEKAPSWPLRRGEGGPVDIFGGGGGKGRGRAGLLTRSFASGAAVGAMAASSRRRLFLVRGEAPPARHVTNLSAIRAQACRTVAAGLFGRLSEQSGRLRAPARIAVALLRNFGEVRWPIRRPRGHRSALWPSSFRADPCLLSGFLLSNTEGV